MGQLINGQWSPQDDNTVQGNFVRQESRFRSAVHPTAIADIQRHRGRFWLIVSNSCPWSHRTTLVRALKNLEETIPQHIAWGTRTEGYPLDGGADWQVPGTNVKIKNLHQLYSLHDSNYSGRATLPVLWDSAKKTIVSNESSDIIAAMDAIRSDTTPAFTLRPPHLLSQLIAANEQLYAGLNNAVYRAGFAECQSAYDTAINAVFRYLDFLETRLTTSRFYFGSHLSETDIRLFPTLVRFDSIYAVLFKCTRKRLVDYPNIWAYARDLYAWPGFAETVDFKKMQVASYLADARDRIKIVAALPETDWTGPHGRQGLGHAQLFTRQTGSPSPEYCAGKAPRRPGR